MASEPQRPETKKYILKLGGAASLRGQDEAARNKDPVFQAGVFLDQLNEVFADRLASAGILPPSEDQQPRLEVECTPADAEQIRCFFAPKVSRVDEAQAFAENDNNLKSFFRRLKIF